MAVDMSMPVLVVDDLYAQLVRDGKPRIAVHRVTGTKHEVEVDALENSKRIAALGCAKHRRY